MDANLETVWVLETAMVREVEGERELHLVWTNGRHHSLQIPQRCSAKQLAGLMHGFAEMVLHDKNLDA